MVILGFRTFLLEGRVWHILYATYKYMPTNLLYTPKLWKPYKVLHAYYKVVQYFIWIPQSWSIQQISWHTFTFFVFVFIGWKLFYFCVYLNLLTWMCRQCLVIPLMFLQSWSKLWYIKIHSPWWGMDSCRTLGLFHLLLFHLLHLLNPWLLVWM